MNGINNLDSSITTDEQTITLKVGRSVITRRYADEEAAPPPVTTTPPTAMLQQQQQQQQQQQAERITNPSVGIRSIMKSSASASVQQQQQQLAFQGRDNYSSHNVSSMNGISEDNDSFLALNGHNQRQKQKQQKSNSTNKRNKYSRQDSHKSDYHDDSSCNAIIASSDDDGDSGYGFSHYGGSPKQQSQRRKSTSIFEKLGSALRLRFSCTDSVSVSVSVSASTCTKNQSFEKNIRVAGTGSCIEFDNKTVDDHSNNNCHQTKTTTTTTTRQCLQKIDSSSCSLLDSQNQNQNQNQHQNQHQNQSNNNSSISNIFTTIKNEAMQVLCIKRMLSIIVTFGIAAIVLVVYWQLKEYEQNQFEKAYDNVATEFFGLVQSEITQNIVSCKSISTELTMITMQDNITWPYFVSPYFALHTQASKHLNKATKQTIYPIVKYEQRTQWELFSITNVSLWINDPTLIVTTLSDDATTSTSGLYRHIPDNAYDRSAQTGHAGRTLSYHQDADGIRKLTSPSSSVESPTVSLENTPATKKNNSVIFPTLTRRDDEYYGNLIEQRDVNLFYTPSWQTSRLDINFINFDLISIPDSNKSFVQMMKSRSTVLSGVRFPALDPMNETQVETTPYTRFFTPIFNTFTANSKHEDSSNIVGFIASLISWERIINHLPLKEGGSATLDLILVDPFNAAFSFRISEATAKYVGKGYLHEPKYSALKRSFRMNMNITAGDDYKMYLYPTRTMEAKYETKNPTIFTVLVLSILGATFLVLFIYNRTKQVRQNKAMSSLHTASKVVLSLFPANVLDRLIKEAEIDVEGNVINSDNIDTTQHTNRIKSAFAGRTQGVLEDVNKECSHIVFKSKPIADLYPSATIMYADIAGFTAWSSVREPSQVFTLLEAIFCQYDILAKRRRIFKVETIGDCYVAVAGVPHQRADHAVAMARFARDCILSMNVLSKQLEVQLGPDTSDLAMRIGLHSGPVTAGILRGEKARFQLFGETVNFCAQMEHTGKPNMIHISQRTADHLVEAGKSSWLEVRHDMSFDDIGTFWLSLRPCLEGSATTSEASSGGDSNDEAAANGSEKHHGNHKVSNIDKAAVIQTDTVQKVVQKHSTVIARDVVGSTRDTKSDQYELDDKVQRLVSWNVELLLRLIKQIIAARLMAANGKASSPIDLFAFRRDEPAKKESPQLDNDNSKHKTVINEVVEIIDMPDFDARSHHEMIDANTVEITIEVRTEVNAFVATIAGLYHDNPFHNFEHASHVTMSVSKLLSRIVAPDHILKTKPDEGTTNNGKLRKSTIASTLHDHTYGITSDPITQFACVFSALIHDADHPGIPNAQLIKECDQLAIRYKNQSIAEQNSVDIAWRLFLDDKFSNFRTTLCPTPYDIKHFRQLVVNSVMATDIVDKELKELRNGRWDTAFHGIACDESVRDQTNRKATIVIEHLIQASDVSHTMQHWHVYQKWNERFYHEMYLAYLHGRSEKDPSEFWYKGEIGFYDFYIIPLAKKLKDCGVFGVSSDEYIQYAMKNRAEWEQRGEEIVARMVQKYKSMYQNAAVGVDEDCTIFSKAEL